MPDGRAAARFGLAALGVTLLAAGGIAARQDDPREREGLRRHRPAAQTGLLLPAGERVVAPSLPTGLEWIQGAAPAADPAPKATLIGFWSLTSAGCLRTLPTVEDLHAFYAPAGLAVALVHQPEFDFSVDTAVVAGAVKRLGIASPVANDPLHRAARAFDNSGWPSYVLIDAAGRVAWRGSGEGDYVRLEERVRALLAEAGVDPPARKTLAPAPADPFGPGCGAATPDVFAGHARGSLANAEGYAPGAPRSYAPPPGIVPPEGQPLLAGVWVAHAEGLAAGDPAGASLALVYEAKSVEAVIRPLAPGPQYIEVLLDGAPPSAARKGADVTIEASGRALVAADTPRLYALVGDAGPGAHRLELRPLTDQAEIVAFTFGNACQAAPSRR